MGCSGCLVPSNNMGEYSSTRTDNTVVKLLTPFEAVVNKSETRMDPDILHFHFRMLHTHIQPFYYVCQLLT